jgi:hypothetical protein
LKPNRTSINLSDPPRSRSLRLKSRHVARLSNLPFLGRTTLLSRIQQVASQVSPTAKFPSLLAFLEFWKWLLPYLRDFVHPDAPYQTYPLGKTGIFSIPTPSDGSPLTMAVAADWGTGTLEAETVADNMSHPHPHFTLHLGDVYYMGEPGEIDENCLGLPTQNYDGVCWPMGSLGSFALMGNHEMYSGGYGYFDEFLKYSPSGPNSGKNRLGLFDASMQVTDPQSASFFCLDTPHWIVLGLDTGYHSGGFPGFTSIPGINAIPWLNVDARFDAKMLAWLRQTIATFPGATSKPVLLLTHHQPLSAFEHPFTKPAQQLADLGFLNNREFVWLYGHEHRLTIYEKQTIVGTLTAYPRCIGHAGMPVEVTKLRKPNPNILYYDPRTHPIDACHPDTLVGYNGHVVLIFHGASLTIEYHDILSNALLFSETFTPAATGALQYVPSKPASSPFAPGA